MEEKIRNISKNIRDYCEQHGMSLQSFEEACNIGNGVFAKWEKGQMTPTLRSLDKLELTTRVPVTRWLEKGAFDDSRKNRVPNDSKSSGPA